VIAPVGIALEFLGAAIDGSASVFVSQKDPAEPIRDFPDQSPPLASFSLLSLNLRTTTVVSSRDEACERVKLGYFGSAHETEKIVRSAQDFEPNHVRGAFLGLHGS
jgi:hypothetical protein